MFLLDTNIISKFIRGDKNIDLNLQRHSKESLSTCTIVKAELFFGVEIHPSPRIGDILRNQYFNLLAVMTVRDFDDASAEVFARIKAILKKAGTPIEDMDLLIASIAIANNLTLVTNNTKHFEKISGLNLADWTK